VTGPLFHEAFSAGAEQVAVWAQLLDRINVFPVADGDTGRNLVISLAPLRQRLSGPEKLCRSLLLAARGNSGNIAARFLQEFALLSSFNDLAATVRRGSDMAYGAVSEPRPGTMLSLLDRLAELCSEIPANMNAAWTAWLLSSLELAVAGTVHGQQVLQQAGVVDAGALGMYIFFDGFFSRLAGTDYFFSPARACFKDNLRIADSFSRETTDGFCIDAVVESAGSLESALGSDAHSAVVMRSGGFIKVHLHASAREKVKSELAACGKIISWADDDLAAQTAVFSQPAAASAVHIMTDAAGSITREDAAALGLTLLDSYITTGDTSLPETCCSPAGLYKTMREGCRCSTAQASMGERHQHYESVLELNTYVLYLCVGSVYTGNYQAASGWKQKHDTDSRFSIIDTGTASGRLAVAVHLTARFARQAAGAAEVEAFARKVLASCHEYIFVDTLGYLAAGGRLSKTGAFFGDLLKFKPVISPQPGGAQKVGMVRNREEQVRFAIDKLSGIFMPDAQGLILLEHTDNRSFVEETAATVQSRFPNIELLVRPLSLTTGVHTGPGTWAVAFAADE
jgi:uncharacterized protein